MDAGPSLLCQAEGAMALLQSVLMAAITSGKTVPGLPGFRVRPELAEHAGLGDEHLEQAKKQPYVKEMQRLYGLYWTAVAQGDLATCRAIGEFSLDVAAMVGQQQQPENRKHIVCMCLGSLSSLLGLCGLWGPLAVMHCICFDHREQQVAAQLWIELARKQMLPPPDTDTSQFLEDVGHQLWGPAIAWAAFMRPLVGGGPLPPAVTEWARLLMVVGAKEEHWAWLGGNPVVVFDSLMTSYPAEACKVYRAFALERWPRCLQAITALELADASPEA